MLVSIIVFGIVAFGAGMYVPWRHVSGLREQLDWYQARDGVGDVSAMRVLETEVRTLRRRIAGLLSSPSSYLRARRIMGPLDLENADLTAELELIEMTT